jgi:hypothetical protein
MRRVGPQPPEPDWDRLDMRGVNGTRQAWGYIDPEDNIIVTNDGRVFIKVERGDIEMTKGNHPLVRLPKHFSSLIRRTFRWVKIIRKMFEFVEEVPDSTEQTPKEAQNEIEEKRLRMKR